MSDFSVLELWNVLTDSEREQFKAIAATQQAAMEASRTNFYQCRDCEMFVMEVCKYGCCELCHLNRPSAPVDGVVS